MQEGCGIRVDRADASGLDSPVASVLQVDKDLSELVGSGASSGSAVPFHEDVILAASPLAATVEPRWCSGLDSI